MKILIITPQWIGGLFESIANAFSTPENEVIKMSYEKQKSILYKVKLHNIIQIKNKLDKKSWEIFNNNVKKVISDSKPDIFISFNESNLFSTTVKFAQDHNCKTINFVADNPFDPLRFSHYPISLKYYHTIIIHDKIWIPSIRNVAKDSKIEKIICGGAFDLGVFFPVEKSEITREDIEKLSCDVSFTGESYGMRGEAGYRSDILDYLGKFDVKIWGDAFWKKRFPYYSNLEKFYQGGRLSYDHLRKLYQISTINLNMPSPQVFTGFQPRTFEIAACKGFQIADWREELDDVFTDEELVTFKNIPDLLEKIEYFTKYPEKRIPYIEKMHKKVIKYHNWDVRVKEIMELIMSQ